MLRDNIDRFFARLEWRWSLANFIWGAWAIASVTLPAWAVKTANLFSDYSPVSWVGAGVLGFLVFCFGFFVYAHARFRLVQARYNERSLEIGATADPLAKVFEKKRIFLNQFAMPSNPFINGKTFVDCEIIGPANIFLASGNRVDEPQLPSCDGAVLSPNATSFNSYSFINCAFRRCSFQRINFFISDEEYQNAPNIRGLDWINWITFLPDSDLPLFQEKTSQDSTKNTPAETGRIESPESSV